MGMLEIKNLYASYGHNETLHGVSLSVEKNEIVSIIGSNGAGKSTLLNCISGLVGWTGEIMFEGAPLSFKSHKVVRTGILQVPEGRKVFAGLSVEDNLLIGAYTNDSKEIHSLLEKQYELFPILQRRRNQDAGTLSGGEQQMLVICRALMANPKLLLLDEPSLGLAPLIVQQVLETIVEIKKSGVTVLLVEQNAKKALKISDKAFVIENGKIVMTGTGAEILNHPGIAEAYLGARTNKR